MSGILYVVATPIGNLEDVTLRALRILREASLIAAEDTRRTSKLLQHYSISTPTTSLHEHNEHVKAGQLVERLRRGESIALVSDAGTPGVSDPGYRLVSAAHEAGVKVVPIPGASAVTAIVSAAGVGSEGFVFVGFPPNRSNSRKKWLADLRGEQRALVLYEAPHRIRALLADIKDELGDRMVALGRELTKAHEELAIRPITTWTDAPPPELGEFVAIIYPGQREAQEQADDRILAAEFFAAAAEPGTSRRDAIRTVASRHRISARQVFAAVERTKESGEQPM